jgi:hypothetical protein
MGMGCSACETDKSAEDEIKQVWDFISLRLFDHKEASKKKMIA